MTNEYDKYDKVTVFIMFTLLLFTSSMIVGNRISQVFLIEGDYYRTAKDLNEYCRENKIEEEFSYEDVVDDNKMLDYLKSIEDDKRAQDIIEIMSQNRKSIFSDPLTVYEYYLNGDLDSLYSKESSSDKELKINWNLRIIRNETVILNVIIIVIIVLILLYTVDFKIVLLLLLSCLLTILIIAIKKGV